MLLNFSMHSPADILSMYLKMRSSVGSSRPHKSMMNLKIGLKDLKRRRRERRSGLGIAVGDGGMRTFIETAHQVDSTAVPVGEIAAGVKGAESQPSALDNLKPQDIARIIAFIRIDGSFDMCRVLWKMLAPDAYAAALSFLMFDASSTQTIQFCNVMLHIIAAQPAAPPYLTERLDRMRSSAKPMAEDVVKWTVKFEATGEIHRYTIDQIQEKFGLEKVWPGVTINHKIRGLGTVLRALDSTESAHIEGKTQQVTHVISKRSVTVFQKLSFERQATAAELQHLITCLMHFQRTIAGMRISRFCRKYQHRHAFHSLAQRASGHTEGVVGQHLSHRIEHVVERHERHKHAAALKKTDVTNSHAAGQATPAVGASASATEEQKTKTAPDARSNPRIREGMRVQVDTEDGMCKGTVRRELVDGHYMVYFDDDKATDSEVWSDDDIWPIEKSDEESDEESDEDIQEAVRSSETAAGPHTADANKFDLLLTKAYAPGRPETIGASDPWDDPEDGLDAIELQIRSSREWLTSRKHSLAGDTSP